MNSVMILLLFFVNANSVFAIKPWTNEKPVYYNEAEWGDFPYVHEK